MRCSLTLRDRLTGATSRGENLITIQGLETASMMWFKAVDQATKEGQQQSPDVESRERYYRYVHCGDGTNVVPDIYDKRLQHYLIDQDNPTAHKGASGHIDWNKTDLNLIAGGFCFSFETDIEWSPDSPDTSITEWCIASEEDYYVPGQKFLNHGTILYYLTGEADALVEIDCLW